MHANLAEAYRAKGDLVRAAGSCRTALRLAPDYPEAANNLGLALSDLGQADAAIAQFRAAVRLRPDFAMAHNNLANALRGRGETAEALAHFRRAVEIDPHLAEAQSNLGQILLEGKELSEALAHCREAVRLRPDFPEAQNNLGNVLRELGRLAEAKACYAEALRLNPDIALSYSNMGQALQEEGRLDDAVTWYRRALELEPNLARTHWNLGSALQEQEKHEEAVVACETAVRLDPDSAEAHNSLGGVYHEQGRFHEALGRFRKAIELKPDFAVAHDCLGTVLEELGDFAAAERCFRDAMRHDPRDAGALAQLATLLRGKLPEGDLAAIRALLSDPSLPDADRSALHFGLAHVLDARGDYPDAAEELERANAIAAAQGRTRGRGYDPAAHARFVASMIANCTPALFDRTRSFGLESERPVFIVGLPRSGTTLIEQILARHPRVFGAGELRLRRRALPRWARAKQGRWKGCAGWTATRCAASPSDTWIGSARSMPQPAASRTRCRTTICTWACWPSFFLERSSSTVAATCATWPFPAGSRISATFVGPTTRSTLLCDSRSTSG